MYRYPRHEGSGVLDRLPGVPGLALEMGTDFLGTLPVPLNIPFIPESFHPRLCGFLRVGEVGGGDPKVKKEMLDPIRIYGQVGLRVSVAVPCWHEGGGSGVKI